MNVSEFGKLADGRSVRIFTLKNANGMTVRVMEFGATLVSLSIPDRNENFEDVLLGYDTLAEYARDDYFFGAIVGRYGNRIKNGKFSLNGQAYQLQINDGKNHLHGGEKGFFRKLWQGKINQDKNGESVEFSLISPDGDQGYPGEVTLNVCYNLTENNELRIEYRGKTDKETILNPTNHAYFNLSSIPENTIRDHALKIDGDQITLLDDESIPTGEKLEVENTPFDFRKARVIGNYIEEDHFQLKNANGYDHNWVLNGYTKDVRMAASLYHPKTGRYLEVHTDQPGIQFYSGNFLNDSISGKMGMKNIFRSGLCLETQHFPDSPNNPDFPSVIVRPGEQYKQTTIYKYSVR